jgi:hypothetical protein
MTDKTYRYVPSPFDYLEKEVTAVDKAFSSFEAKNDSEALIVAKRIACSLTEQRKLRTNAVQDTRLQRFENGVWVWTK